MIQQGLEPHFNGPAYDPAIDFNRLSKQLGRVYNCLSSGRWLTLNEISELTKDPPASISAQLRHLRKERFGGYIIERRRRGDPSGGLFEYRLGGKRYNGNQINLF